MRCSDIYYYTCVLIPIKITYRECFMAIIAAMKKVLSPSSEKMIIISDEKKASEETHTHTHTHTHISIISDRSMWDTMIIG